MTPQNPYGWWLPLDASVNGHSIDQLINVIHWFMAVLFIGWGIYLVYVLIRFRERPGHKATPEVKHFRLPTWLEVGVAIFEVFLLLFVSSPIWFKVKKEFPNQGEAEIVRVVAEQFAWNFHYPGKDGKFGRSRIELVDGTNPVGLDRNDPAGKDDIISVNQFHVPTGKPVIVYLSSKDVIHSFFLPVLRVKQDAIPGMTIPLWFEAKIPGQDFEVACAQLCGVSHARMRGYLHIDTPEEYAKWIDEQEKELLADNSSSTPEAAQPAAATETPSATTEGSHQ